MMKVGNGKKWEKEWSNRWQVDGNFVRAMVKLESQKSIQSGNVTQVYLQKKGYRKNVALCGDAALFSFSKCAASVLLLLEWNPALRYNKN